MTTRTIHRAASYICSHGTHSDCTLCSSTAIGSDGSHSEWEVADGEDDDDLGSESDSLKHALRYLGRPGKDDDEPHDDDEAGESCVDVVAWSDDAAVPRTPEERTHTQHRAASCSMTDHRSTSSCIAPHWLI